MVMRGMVYYFYTNIMAIVDTFFGAERMKLILGRIPQEVHPGAVQVVNGSMSLNHRPCMFFLGWEFPVL